MCDMQLLRHTGSHQNFSVLGLTILLSCGGLVILLSLVAETVVGWIQNRTGLGKRGREQWIVDGVLQLQRSAYEGQMIESVERAAWIGEEDPVPATEGYIRLGSLAGKRKEMER